MSLLDIIKEIIDAEVIVESAALSIGFGLSSMFYHFYNKNQSICKKVDGARKVAINPDLLRSVKDHEKDFQYVAVCGIVQADGNPLRSRYFPERKGVILNFVTEESSEVWVKYSHAWYENRRELSNITEDIPFSLTEGNDAAVHIVNPLESPWCRSTLAVVNKEFREPNTSVMDSIFGVLTGNRVKGFTDTERMLQVGTQILGIGELVVEDGTLKLKKPPSGEYIITTAAHGDVVTRIGSKAKVFRVFGFLFLGATLSGLYFVLKRLRKKYLDALESKRMTEEVREIRRLREDTNRRLTGNAAENGHDEKCVICLTNPRECVILDCGHVCACVDCMENLPTPKSCPMCRTPIARIVPLFHA